MNKLIKETIQDLEISLTEAEMWLEDKLDQWVSGKIENVYVVGRDGIFLVNVGIGEDSRLTGEYGFTHLTHDAQEFTEDHAKIIAGVTKNGNGMFEAIKKTTAVRKFISETEKQIQQWELAAKQYAAK